VIMTHGDDKGLVLPPRIATYQVVIVPIGRDEVAERTAAAARELADRLKKAGIRVHVDERTQLRPGFKYNDWEMRGVPIRLEIGARDLDAGVVTLARRLGDQGKEQIPLDRAAELLPGILEDFQAFLYDRAKRFRDEHIATVESWDDFPAQVSGGWARVFHCGRTECEDAIKADTAATPRCIPSEAPEEQGVCFRCGEPSAYGKRILFGRSY
jgi:prolyl-tRNA synthetase